MLSERLAVGVRITGLFDLISDGRPPMDASWSFERNLLSANVISFQAGRGGGHVITVLPYRRGENASTPMTGGEVISGEFTGCIMGVYREDGIAKVNHVDTEKNSDDEMPQKDAWEAQKASDGFELFNEASTQGEIPKYIDGMSDSKLSKYGTGLVVLSVASARQGYPIQRAMVFREKNHDYKVLKILD